MIEDIILELPQHTWRMLEIRISQDADAYLTKLPWEISGHRLDWSRIKSKYQVILYSDDIYESKDIYQLKNFNCFNGTHCIFFYSAWKASILIETSVAIMNFNIFSITPCASVILRAISLLSTATPERARSIRKTASS